MRRTSVLVFVMSLVMVAMAIAPVLAQQGNPHFKKGGEPVCRVTTSGSTSSTVCTASLTGLSNEDLNIDLTVGGSAVYQCQNQGGNTAPGQNRVLVGPVTAPTTIPADQVKNGNVTFTTNPAVLTAPSTVTGAEAGPTGRALILP
jgi:hypothetical protein